MLLNQIILEKAFAITGKNEPANFGVELSRRRRNAINKAFRHLLENPFINYENGKLFILSDSITEDGAAKFYETTRNECRQIEPGNFLCHAFWEGYPCWHRATLAIVETYLVLSEGDTSIRTGDRSVDGVNT